jgi:hypothetical protein
MSAGGFWGLGGVLSCWLSCMQFFMLVFRNRLVIVRVSGLKYVNVTHFVFSFCAFCVVCGCFGGGGFW